MLETGKTVGTHQQFFIVNGSGKIGIQCLQKIKIDLSNHLEMRKVCWSEESKVPISWGEMVDKLSILRIKREKFFHR